MHVDTHGTAGRKHSRDRHDHDRAHHLPAAQGMTAILGGSLAATLALVLMELVAGYAGHSIALVSDAIHNLTDMPSLVISWLATRWALRPPTPEKTYGYQRAGILAAFLNSLLLALVAMFLIYECTARLRKPVEVQATLMLWVSIFALAVNGGITLAVHAGRRDLNVRSVWIHNLGDSLSNIAVIVGAGVIRLTGANWIDAVLGIAIGVLVLWSGAGILRESTHIFLEGLPRGLSLEDVARALLRIEGVHEVHDVHIWTLGSDLYALSCHVRIPDMHMEESERILRQINAVLADDFRITHTTIQFERAGLPAQAGLYMPAPASKSEK
jgi:cobalt-zinc-cadmium efflux system protein